MASSALRAKWMLYLVLVLVCQTARRIEGHPRASTETSPPAAGTSSTQNASSISELIEAAYNRHELLRREQWSQQDQPAGMVQRDVSKQLEPLDNETSGMSRYEKRKLLEVLNVDISLQSDGDGEKIIFPTDRRVSTAIATPAPTSDCQMNTFCENVAGYPKDLVNAAIARNASLRFLQSIDPMPDIEQRIDTTDESPLCRYREQVVYPQTAQNKEKQWLFVVNQDNLKQGIRIEVCLNDGQECNLIEGFAEGYRTSCKQKFIFRELAAVNNDGKIIKDQFRFPSSCCCHVKFTGDPSVRVGLRSNSQSNQSNVVSRLKPQSNQSSAVPRLNSQSNWSNVMPRDEEEEDSQNDGTSRGSFHSANSRDY